MIKSEMQHQYWVTKKTVQRKFGSKEDACIVSSDAELDAKIELFKSINDSCLHLHRVIDNYQERVCVLAQEENALGKFLKESGKGSATCGKVMSTAGKALSFCGQQRVMLRPPLLRMLQEVETFRGRAIMDTHMTIQNMERERTEYRAALSWMKSASAQLDPDTGRGLDKFRKAQQHVRASKDKFDRYTLDCLQKIDLLAAARCNMFSHALVAYQVSLLEIFTKTTETFKITIAALENEPHYSFTILKELTQNEGIQQAADENVISNEIKSSNADSDQLLFFKDEYKDESQSDSPADCPSKLVNLGIAKLESSNLLQPTLDLMEQVTSNVDLLGLSNESFSNTEFGDFMSAGSLPYMPSQLLLTDLVDLQFDAILPEETTTEAQNNAQLIDKSNDQQKSKSSIMDFFNRGATNKSTAPTAVLPESFKDKKPSKRSSSGQNQSNWMDLFAELDPLANPDLMEKKLGGNSSNSQAV